MERWREKDGVAFSFRPNVLISNFIDLICNCIRSIFRPCCISHPFYYISGKQMKGGGCGVCPAPAKKKKIRLVCTHTHTLVCSHPTHSHSLAQPTARSPLILIHKQYPHWLIYPFSLYTHFFTILFDISNKRRWMLFKVYQTRYLK